MSSKTAEVCAAIGTTLVVGGAVILAACYPEAFKTKTVIVEPKPTVRVVSPTPPGWGVPAYKVSLGQPYIISSSRPTEIRLPHSYKYRYVIYNGNHYAIHSCNGSSYYIYNGIHYPVYYY